MFVHNDMTGQQISVGDIVIFTQPGAGRNLPSLRFGEVAGFTKATIKVFYLDKQYRREQVEELVEDRSVPPYYIHPRTGEEYFRYVGTGRYGDKAPQAVKVYKDRFYIAKKV